MEDLECKTRLSNLSKTWVTLNFCGTNKRLDINVHDHHVIDGQGHIDYMISRTRERVCVRTYL